MKSTHKIKEEIKLLQSQVEACVELAQTENRDLNADEISLVDKIQGKGDQPGELHAKQEELERAAKYETLVANKMLPKLGEAAENPISSTEKKNDISIRFKSAFRPGVFNQAKDAYDCGQFILATIYGNKKSERYCVENGIPIQNAMTTGDNTKGGFLVPEPLEASIIELREQYGVFARYAQQVTMGDAVMNWPKLQSEISTYYVGENSAITTSDMAIGQVRLEAKKLASLTPVSTELTEDSVISVAEMLARSVAQQFAYAEDLAGFNGDGTSTYGGITGLASALAAGSIHDALSGNVGFTTYDMADFETCMSKCKMYPGANKAWFISQVGWANSMQRLMDAIGGTGGFDIAAGMPYRFLGYPVVISQVLNSALTSTTSTIQAYFGDLSMCAMLGRRRSLSIQSDSSYYFNQDAIAIRATQRYDIVVHDRGTASAGGGIIALKAASS